MVGLAGDEVLLSIETYTGPAVWYAWKLGDTELRRSALSPLQNVLQSLTSSAEYGAKSTVRGAGKHFVPPRSSDVHLRYAATVTSVLSMQNALSFT